MKKSSNKKISPAKYIQTRARNLPIYECWVNPNWRETDMATVSVARQHVNGHITMALYLVDLLCMGVKETFFTFNIPLFEYEDFKEEQREYFEGELEDIDYNLAHNIIFAGVDFATGIGLDACKDFTNITQYLLEEDNDDIPLIDIECGMDGMPVILSGPHNRREADELYKKLRESIGVENFIVRELRDSDEEDDFGDDDEEWEDEGEFDEVDEDEIADQLWHLGVSELEDYIYTDPLKERFHDIELIKHLDKSTDDQDEDANADYADAMDRLFYNHFGYETVDESREQIYNFFDLPLEPYPLPDTVLGFDKELHPVQYRIVEEVSENLQQGTVNLLKTTVEHPDIPLFKYLFLMELEMTLKHREMERVEEDGDWEDEEYDENEDDEKFEEQQNILKEVLDGYRKLHPDYLPLQIIEEEYGLQKNEPSRFIEKMLADHEPISDLFTGRKSIHPIEVKCLIRVLFQYFLIKEDVLAIDSLIYFIQKEHPQLGYGLNHMLVTSFTLRTFVCKKQYFNENRS